MKTISSLGLIVIILTASLQIRLFHDNKKGYSYSITGPSVEEITEADQRMRQYLRSLAPKKNTGPAPSTAAPRPVPPKR
jgi:hypothetical protein